MKKNTRILLSFLVVLAIIALVYAKLVDNQQKAQSAIYIPEKDPSVYVAAKKVLYQPFVTSISYLGTLRPIKESNLYSQLASRVQSVLFKEGDFVRAGKLLVQLDDDLLQSQYAASLAAFKNDSVTYNRYVLASNSAPGSVSKNQLEQLATKMRASRSAYEAIVKQIDFAKLKAPFSGFITKRFVEEGALVSPGISYAHLAAISTLKCVVMVNEKDVLALRIGKRVAIEVDELGAQREGRITFVSPQADRSYKYAVHVLVNNSNNKLRAGMNARMNVRVGVSNQKKSLFILRSALLGSALRPEAYVVRDGRAYIQQLVLGRTSDEYIEVVEGLKQGDEVVVSGQINLANGRKVIVNSKQQ